jgi:hypothetical protein
MISLLRCHAENASPADAMPRTFHRAVGYEYPNGKAEKMTHRFVKISSRLEISALVPFGMNECLRVYNGDRFTPLTMDISNVVSYVKHKA